MPPSNNALPGILLALSSFAFFSFSDASVKLIHGALPPYQSAFFGALFGLAALPFIRRRGDAWTDVFRTVNRPLWWLRFLSTAAGTIGSVTAFTHLSMAEAFALIFLLPAFVTVMSVLFLREAVGLRRWAAVAIGFAGVLIVLRPGFRELSIGHLGAIFGGLAGAINIVMFRAIGGRENRLSLIGAGTLGTLLICGILMLPTFVWPDPVEWSLLASYGLQAALANVLLMLAANHAPAAMIGPIQYSQMLWAILFGFLIFGDGVDAPMLAGIVLIVGSGLLTLARETARRTPLPPSVATPPQPVPSPALSGVGGIAEAGALADDAPPRQPAGG